MRGACREPELDRSGLSTWQGRTHAPAPCLCQKAPREAMIEQVVIRQIKHGRQISLGKCRKIHATRSSPSGLGMMQPEGRPQQSNGLGMMQPEGRPQQSKLKT